MTTDFLSILDDSNSKKDEATGEITITVPNINISGKFRISTKCNIKSNCDTVISCQVFEIDGDDVVLSNLNFETGIDVDRTSNFTMSHCTIKKSKKPDASLSISHSENVSLSYITITEPENIPGLYVNLKSNVNADNLTITGFTESLIVCKNESILFLKDSELSHTQANGIFSTNQSYIEISNCHFSHTKFSAVYVCGSQLNLSNCAFEHTEQNALGIYKSEDFLVEKCTFKNINGTAIQICDESVGKVNSNKISDIEGNGIYCSSRSTVECRGNEISGLSYPGIAITNASTASLFENVISRIEYSGIAARNAKSVRVEGSTISDVGQSGVSVSDTEECVVEGNELARCAITGVESFNGSRAVVRGNAMREMGKYAFLAYTSGTIDASGNRIDGVGVAMAKLAYRGGGEFVGNELRGCAQQCEVKAAAPFFMSGNGNLPGATNDASRVTESVVLKEADEGDCGKCLKCGVGGRDFYLLECGHRVYCRECAEAALRAKEACPLCRFPIVNVTSGFSASEDDSCIICFDRKADCIILPCGHIGVCAECLENWFKNKQCCPICRSEPSFYKKISKYM